MALEEEFGQTRTEAPTPRRREEARAEGQVAFSNDLTTGLVLLTGIAALAMGGQAVAAALYRGLQRDWLHLPAFDLDPARAQGIFTGMLGNGLEILGFFLAILVVAGVAVPALQVGFQLTPGLMALRWDRISPAQGWSRFLSQGAFLKGLIAVFKVAAIALVTWWVLRDRLVQIAGLSDAPLVTATSVGWRLIVQLGLAVAGALVVLGLADYAYQRWRLEQSLRMTRQELKEELKREEGDPMVKARIRKLQRAAAQKRMFQDVPKATVVLTNPTHLAVALRYDAGAMAAPRVVAKGAGFVAERIVALARQHGVPVLERKPIAQALFKAVNIGQEIPAALYVVVAEVMAQVYRMRGFVRS